MSHPLLQPETIALVRALKNHLREHKIELREFTVDHEGSSLRGAVVEGVRVKNRYDDKPVLNTKISDNQRRVLQVLADAHSSECNCYYIRGIASESGLDERTARLAVRALARKGLAKLERGLFDYDGMVAGSGYRSTHEGAMLVNGCVTCNEALADMITGECDRCWEARREFEFTEDWGDYKKGDRIKKADIGDGAIFKELYFGTIANHYDDKKIKDDTPPAPWCCEHCDHIKKNCAC